MDTYGGQFDVIQTSLDNPAVAANKTQSLTVNLTVCRMTAWRRVAACRTLVVGLSSYQGHWHGITFGHLYAVGRAFSFMV